jgi:hypothetical protein
MTRYHSKTTDLADRFIWNNSHVAIYDVQWFSADQQGNSTLGADVVDCLQAGEKSSPTDHGRPVNHALPCGPCNGYVYRDNAGVRWIKWGDGRLEKAIDVHHQIAGPDAVLRMNRHYSTGS